MRDKVGSSRVGRLWQMASAARSALPLSRARHGAMPGQDEIEDPRQILAAEALARTLGELKGLGLKVGQMLSYMDGIVPAQSEPIVRRVLGKLQSQAPALSWETAKTVLSAELGAIDEHFAAIDSEPLAAASLGQVHRATLHDGAHVVVKVQYPGIRESIESDMKNLTTMKGMAWPLLAVLGAGQNAESAGEMITEIRDRLREEVDYEREARMQSILRQRLSDTADVVIPRVYPEHSSGRVLTSEFMAGAGLEQVADFADRGLRDRWAHALTRAVTDQIWVHGMFNADPHPGNYLFRDDGTVVLLDFGCIKEFSPSRLAGIKRYLRAAIVATRTDRPEDWETFDAAIDGELRFDTGDPSSRAMMRATLLDWITPILRDAPFHFSRDYVAGINARLVQRKQALLYPGGRRLPKMPRMPKTPGDFAFLNRLQWGFYSVLCRLDATVNWHAMLPADVRG